MKHQLILARAIGYNCAALIVNQVVVAEAGTPSEIDRLVVTAARQLSVAMGEPLVECAVAVPEEMDGTWVWSDLVELLPPMQEQTARHELVIYCWSEGGVHPATVDGPGDAWDELCFDTQAPIAGTPYFMLAPLHQVAARKDSDQLVEQVAMLILGKDVDLAPGINWHCDRAWRVNDVRQKVRQALEKVGVIPAAEEDCSGVESELSV
jgi:hypothetical protein